MYKSSPAFSIKGKCIYLNLFVIDNQTSTEIKPSPFAYNTEHWNLKKTPSWK